MDARDLPLAVLTAPAGYGKTTALLDWAQHDPRPFAWVALGRADDDPDQLLGSVQRSTGVLGQRGSAPVLVLDGVDVLRSSGALRALSWLVEHPPACAQVVLASRSEPPVCLGRRRAQRHVLELTARDFAMTRGEAATLLERAGLALGPAQVDALVARTEGWPVGLYLAALSLRGRPDVAAAAAAFGGEDRLVADYVADAVLADLPGDQVAFLLRTSVLDGLCGRLCDDVLGELGELGELRSGVLLKRLARANVPLVALDRSDEWYRYQRLFAQALRAELRRRDPGLEPELHRRASRWHAAAGDLRAAVRHAAAAGDVRLAGDVLWTNVLRDCTEGRQGTVRRWLDGFSAEQTSSYAPLALAAATCHLARGERDLAEHWTLLVAGSADCTLGRREIPSLGAGVAALRAAIARDGVARMRDDAARAYELAAGDGPWRSFARQLEGTACHLLGERDRARTLLRDGVRRGLVAAPAISALCLAQLAFLAHESGERHDAADLASRARAQVERLRLGEQPAISLVLAAAALTKARLGQVEAAERDACAATRLRERLADVAPWYLAEVAIALAQVMVRLANIGRARALLDDAARVLRGAPDAVVLTTWLDGVRAQADAYCASAAVAAGSLTAAELRILRMLPTHLSLREIGLQHYVSPNTVKTQAQAVYRKLDARSRSEAVSRAHELGLLGSALTR